MAEEAERLMQAISLAFSPAYNDQQRAVKEQATSYCDAFKKSPDGWKLCLQGLPHVTAQKGSDAVKFYFIAAILDVVRLRYHSITEDERNSIRSTCMMLVRDVCSAFPQSHAIKNKLCCLFVGMVSSTFLKFFRCATRHHTCSPC
jgi:hypothetical protein